MGAAPAYPIAFGAWAGGHGAAAGTTGALFLHALACNLISAGQRLGLLGQTAGQVLLSRLAPLCEALAKEAAAASLEDVGGAAFRGDLLSIRHETQRVRLFRS